MRAHVVASIFATVFLLAGCAGRDEPSPSSAERAAEPVAAETGGQMSDRVQGPARPPEIRRLEVHPADVAEAEDGHGQVVEATRPVALDVIADGWPGRALDPVLLIGQELRFIRYRHPGPGVLRFVAADGEALPRGAPVHLQWGDDVRTRLLVTARLEVSP